ncbi:MAG: sulfotransferase family protein [Bryobacteraceae bacterium]
MSTGSNLIFVISQPRAGSTLLQRILAAHPAIHTASEPWIALHPLFALRPEGVSCNYSHALARNATLEFLSQLPGGQDSYYEGVRRMLGHLYECALAGSQKTIFLDKTPRYYFIISELRRTFPEARFVFILRNPLAVFSSMMETWVKGIYFGKLCSLRNDLVHDLLTAPDLIMNGIRDFGPDAAVLRYEELAVTPDAAVRRLCRDLAIDFHPGMIDYGTEGRNLERWSYGDQGTVYSEQRPIGDRAERWQQVLRNSSPWMNLAKGYLLALGRRLIVEMGYDYGELKSILGIPDEDADCPEFLATAVLNHAYGETRDFVYQLQYFQKLVAEHNAANERIKSAEMTVKIGKLASGA